MYLPRREAFEPPRQRPPGRAPGGNTYTTLYTHRHQRRRGGVGGRRGIKGNVRLDGRTKMSAPRLLNRQKEERYEITYLYITIFYTKDRDKDNRQFNRLIKY